MRFVLKRRDGPQGKISPKISQKNLPQETILFYNKTNC